MKKSITIITVLFVCFSLSAQFYYYEGEKIYLTKKTNKMFIKLSEKADKQGLLDIILADDSVKLSAGYENFGQFAVLEAKDSINISFATLNKYILNSNIASAQLMLEYKNITLIGLIDEFIVKLKPTASLKQLQNLMSKYSCVIVRESPYVKNQYLVSVSKTSALNALQTSNMFFETGLFEFSAPNFAIINALCSNDTYFNDQWGLKNTGQYDGLDGTDINVECAWEITQGNLNIKIAVIDDGVDLEHPDLNPNLLSGFSVYGNLAGASLNADKGHGTVCAGIIGAVKDNITGISGVAPGCKIIPVNANDGFSSGFFFDDLESAIYWAFRYGNADVISNSWGGFVSYEGITNAINAAVTEGRGGKGCVVVASAGNADYPAVIFPANLSNVIAVGAMSPCGERKYAECVTVVVIEEDGTLTKVIEKIGTSCDSECWWGSSYGENLDVIAPGVLISTTDLQNNDGYNPNTPIHIRNNGTKLSADYSNLDYTVWANGTSSACPHVAGVAALILSVNPNLTWQEVKNIIEKTAQKTRPDLYAYATTQGRPNGTWHEEVGYGLVDACAAVQYCLTPLYFTTPTVTNDTTVTHCGDIYVQNVIVQGATLTIEAGGNIYVQYVTIENNSTLILDAGGEVNIISDFEVELGSELGIR